LSGDAEDLEEDFDGLFPVVLSARFEREVAVNEWFGQLTVIWFRGSSRNDNITSVFLFTSKAYGISLRSATGQKLQFNREVMIQLCLALRRGVYVGIKRVCRFIGFLQNLAEIFIRY